MPNVDKWSLLAGLRFVLASIVAVNHLGSHATLGWLSFVPRLGAFEAVLGFLLISGYSVSVSCLKEPEGFLTRRLMRVYPIYLASIGLTLLVNVFLQHEKVPDLDVLLPNLLFLNQLFTTTSYVGPAWSLSLEFWLYCLAPVLLVAPPVWNRAIVYMSFATFLCYTVSRAVFQLPYYSDVGFGANLCFLAFIWVCGLRLASPDEDPGRVLRDIRWMFAGHLGLTAALQGAFRFKNHALDTFWREDLLTLALQSLTLGVVYLIFSGRIMAPDSGGRRSGFLRFLGDISYPLYLIHIPVFVALQHTPLHSAELYFLAAVAVSALLYRVVDVYSRRRHPGLKAVPVLPG